MLINLNPIFGLCSSALLYFRVTYNTLVSIYSQDYQVRPALFFGQLSELWVCQSSQSVWTKTEVYRVRVSFCFLFFCTKSEFTEAASLSPFLFSGD